MNYVNLGRSGLKVSRLCLGCMTYGRSSWRPWVLDEDKARPFIRRALDAGINFFDTADMYSIGTSEEVLGRALKDFARRDDVVIATKVNFAMSDAPNDRGLSRKHILSAIDASLKRLGTDFVDLYQIHRADPTTPIEETIAALDEVVRAGKALHVGASTMPAWQLAKYLFTADRMGAARFVSMQNHLNLVYREEEREMMPLCRDQGVGMIPYSPMARGFLAGNRTPGVAGKRGDTVRANSDQYADEYYFGDADFAVAEAVAKVAAQRGVKPAQVALAWVLAQPGVTAPIIGASKDGQLEDAIAALDIVLGGEEMAAIEAPYRPRKWES